MTPAMADMEAIEISITPLMISSAMGRVRMLFSVKVRVASKRLAILKRFGERIRFTMNTTINNTKIVNSQLLIRSIKDSLCP